MKAYKEINGFDFTYFISDCGDVQKVHNRKLTILKVYDNGIGYKMVSMKQNKKYKMIYVHRLVAQCFLENENELKCNEVNHIDGNKSNNHFKNLEWCTRAQNMKHAADNGLMGKRSIYFGKKVININTGEIYETAKDASIISGIKYKTLLPKLLGHHNNKTPYRYQ